MKVLIISHNCFSTHQSMGKTFLSLFSSFRKEELCQLYIYPSIPDVDVCNSYYRITDKQLITSFLGLKRCGGEIDKTKIQSAPSTLFENSEDMNIYRKRGNNGAGKRILRDVLWKVSHWYTRDLKKWVEREKPDCIFLSPGYAKFIYDIALQISKDYNLPIVTYICDDYYFVKQPDDVVGRLYLKLLKSKTDKLFKRTSCLVAISEEVKNEYSSHFGVKSETIMTGSNYPVSENPLEREHVSSLSYFGNLALKRERSLAEIGKTLDVINLEKGTSVALEIFTAEKDASKLSVFDGIKSVHLNGFVSGEEFKKRFYSSDALLHVEAFDSESVDTVKHSVSTKIADSLGSGITLFAYAPEGISSVEHLRRNSCAVIADSEDRLKESLEGLLFDAQLRRKTVVNALETARAYHDSSVNSKRLYNIFEALDDK